MHSSAKHQSPPVSVLLFCLFDKVDHKQDVRFPLSFFFQIRLSPANHNSNPLHLKRACTVINDHD